MLSHQNASNNWDDAANLSSNPPALLELLDVKRQFTLGQVTVQALRGISVQIVRGESVAVWGPSGSGKSTLMNLLGLIDVPDAGQIRFDGENVNQYTDDRLADFRNRKIGFIFQSFNLIPVLNALENVMLPLQVQGVPDGQARERAMEWLDQVGLEKFATFRPDRLSGGQRQRTAIARALVIDPMLIIADEPTANLDSENSHSVIELIRSMNQLTGVTCVFSTHDPRLLDQVPRHLLLKDGQILEDRRVEAVQ
ncbi:MAG: ABC transporter ATP-binding protein [Proteobacteria bacterium]|nr:ABC transporter ATP-binding protein [Desulfocapsa sp.]MBU4030534.1 ABC transporter ATP-binding protein [Pseudomonadota bacterium]MBU4044704.1 ABC transporter ATP-binding protein [Pseudomonadota bacterium]